MPVTAIELYSSRMHGRIFKFIRYPHFTTTYSTWANRFHMQNILLRNMFNAFFGISTMINTITNPSLPDSDCKCSIIHHIIYWREHYHAMFPCAGSSTELTHYYRPDGVPREQQPWLASVWRRLVS